MKQLQNYLLCLILFSLFSTNIIAQELKYSNINTVGHSKGYTSYVSKDGTVYKIGDTLKLVKPSVDNSFLFVRTSILGLKSQALPRESGKETIITNIRVIEQNTGGWENKGGYYVEFKTTGASYSFLININDAIQAGEVRGLGMTSDEALTSLKKSKDKLDLGLITPAEYEKTKNELVKYIK
jgi:hypothetical protein